jgi:hypothetical protein
LVSSLRVRTSASWTRLSIIAAATRSSGNVAGLAGLHGQADRYVGQVGQIFLVRPVLVAGLGTELFPERADSRRFSTRVRQAIINVRAPAVAGAPTLDLRSRESRVVGAYPEGI